MADDEQEAIHAAELKKRRQFRKYAYRGVDLEDLLDKSSEEVQLPSFFSTCSSNVFPVDPTRPCESKASFPTWS